jgi:hypothetical protein
LHFTESLTHVAISLKNRVAASIIRRRGGIKHVESRGISLALALLAMSTTDTTQPDWALNATTIEACRCPMFCQCYSTLNLLPITNTERQLTVANSTMRTR